MDSSMEEGTETNREGILADFQACTGIEDIAQAIETLETVDWNLLLAINNVLPQDTQTLPSERSEQFSADFNNHHITHNLPTTIIKQESKAAATTSTSTASDPFKNSETIVRQTTSVKPTLIKASTSTSATSASSNNNSNFAKKEKSNRDRVVDLTDMADNSDAASTNSDVEDMVEESFPLDEEYYVPDLAAKRPQKYLISENTTDETVGAIQFADNFSLRYGSCHPMFLQGTLEDAVKEASNRAAKDRKQLAIYLHHDGSVMANIFCQQILCSESIVSFLSMNFVVWGWDVTNESNRQMLLTAVGKNFGTPGVLTIRQFEVDRYPVIIIVSRNRSSTEVSSVINSTVNVDELMGTLIHSVEVYKSQQIIEMREEEEREARELVKRQQDEAYEESLQADRAKEEAKKNLEMLKQREEQDRLDEISKAEAQRAEIARSLPEEPKNDSTLPVCSLKCRLPTGQLLSRKFFGTTQLKVLFDYLFSEGFPKSQYKFLTTYPKRDLTEMDETTLMKDLFSAQDTFIVEKR